MESRNEPPHWSWNHTMLRVRDPDASLRFYCDILKLTLVHRIEFTDEDASQVSLLFLQSLPTVNTPGDPTAEYNLRPGSQEAHEYVFSSLKPMLKLYWKHGTETDKGFSGYHPGNQSGDGFGHIAVSVVDVYESCERLQKANVGFRKLPNEGRMKGLAFALDPDGYWVEIVRRMVPATTANLPEFTLAQTMLRIKDPKASLLFYTQNLNMKLVNVRHFSDFSLYFLTSDIPTLADCDIPAPESPEAADLVRSKLYPLGYPVLELTHNHGTENQPDFAYDSGNSEGRLGFGHLGFVVDNVVEASDELLKAGFKMHMRPKDLPSHSIAFGTDPDGYLFEVFRRQASPL